MKKIIALLLICVCFLPLFCACDDGEKKWLEFETKYEEFSKDANYSPYITGNIYYTNNINNVKNNASSDFYVLSKYETLLHYAFVNSEKFYQTFKYQPLFNKTAGSGLCNVLINGLKNVKNNIANFEIAKTSFEENMNYVESTDSAAAKEYLKVFSAKFGQLICDVNNFSNSFSNAFITLYSDGVSRNENITTTGIKQSCVKVFAELYNAYVLASVAEFDNIYYSGFSEYYDKLEMLELKIHEDNVKVTSYKAWLTKYDEFVDNLDMFQKSLKAINYKDITDKSDISSKNHKQIIDKFMTDYAISFLNNTNNLLFY